MTLGERIIELRNTRGISQADLAEAMGVSRQSVSKWETGASTPDLEKLVKLAEYFQLSLDQLVKGEMTENGEQEKTEKGIISEASRPVSQRTKAQSVGIFFLCLSAFFSILFAIIFGIWGVLFAVPFLLFGLICYLVKSHPILKAVWSDYILLSLFFHYCTAIHPSNILLTFQWTYQMNYGILMFSWIWFAVVIALIIGTAITLRKKACSRKQITLGVVLFVLSYIPGTLSHPTFWSWMLCTYLQLAGLTILAINIARWIVSRKGTTNRNCCES